jgi:hypothetical protein
MKVHHGLATYRGGASDVNQGCAMWLPTFLQRGIHFFGERTEVWAFNNFVLFESVTARRYIRLSASANE